MAVRVARDGTGNLGDRDVGSGVSPGLLQIGSISG